MNKTIVFVTFAVLVFLALVEALVLLIFAPEHFSTLTSYILLLLGLASTFAATVWSLGTNKKELENVKKETSAKLDVVQRQTNGTLTKLISRNNELAEENRSVNAENVQLRIMLGLPPKKVGSDND